MKGIRLTPFLLFLILLLVLVVAMIFGYRSNSVLENMETGNTGDWMVSNSAPVENYYNNRTLDEVLPSSGSAEGYYFDPNNGNIVVSSGANSSTFTVLTRSSDGKPTTVTSSYPENTQSSDSEITSMATPWSYNTNNMSLLYCPYQTSTFIVLINNSEDDILAVFKNTNGQSYSLSMSDLAGGQSTGITTNADLSLYSQLGVPQNDNIQVNGEAMKVVKIQNDVYYSKQQGVIVGSPGDFSDQSISSSFQNGVSKQNNQGGSIMVLSVMIDSEHVLVAIVIKNNGNYQVASSNIVAQKAGSQDAGDDSFSVTLKTSGDSGSLEGLAGSNSSSSSSTKSGRGRTSSGSSDKCNEDDDDDDKPCYSKHSKSNDTPKSKCSLESKSKCDDDEYIRKTEIVPPVCPACPTTNCPLSVNSNGEIVDCTGKKIDMGQVQGANQGSFSSSPESWAGAVGGTAEQTVKSAGDTIQTGLKEAGDTIQTGLQAAAPAVETTVKTAGSALENTVDQAGDALDKAFDTVGGAFNTTVGGVENIAGGIGQGLEDAGSGATSLLKDAGSGVGDVAKDVVGFGNNVVNQTAGLISGAGRGALEYGEREQQLEYDKMLQQQQQQGQGQQGYGVQQSGYVPQQGYGYPQQGFAYGQPQQCCYSQQPTQGYSYPRSCSSNFMPITNDFSQFT